MASMADKPELPSFWEILKEKALRRIIKSMIAIAGVGTQAAFAKKVGVNANQISRYCTGKEFPNDNLAVMGAAIGLSEDNLMWLIGDSIVETYEYARVEIPKAADEIREPRSPYDPAVERDLREKLTFVMALDLNRIEPHERIRLARERTKLRKACSPLHRLGFRTF